MHYIVIGGGVSGILSALILAKHGEKVTLVEQSNQVGTTIRGFMRGGVYFDSGLHFTGGLEAGESLDKYFRYLGIEAPVFSFDPQCYELIRLPGDGGDVRLPVGFSALEHYLCEYFPNAQATVRAYLHDALNVSHSSDYLNFSGEVKSVSNPLWLDSLTHYLDQTSCPENLRTVLSSPSILYGVSPDESTFYVHALVAASYFHSVSSVEGGGRVLVGLFEKRLAAMGVDILCGQAVDGIISSPAGAVKGIRLADGTVVEGDGILYTGSPAHLPDILPDNLFRPAFRRRLRSLESSASAYMLLGRCRTLPECLDHKNLICCVQPAFAKAFTSGHLPPSGPFYVAAGPRTDPADASSWHGIMAFAPGDTTAVSPWANSKTGKRPEAYRTEKERILQQMEEALRRACPELDGVEFFDGATPWTIRDYLHTPDGSLYGCKHSIHQYNPLPVTRVENFFIAGQAVVTPGLLGAAVSAFLTCGYIIGKEKLHTEVRQ